MAGAHGADRPRGRPGRVVDPFRPHPESAEKIGPGIRAVEVRLTQPYGTRCFWLGDVRDPAPAEGEFSGVAEALVDRQLDLATDPQRLVILPPP
ncbi:MAG: DUF3223 domain-containing protein, partial [Pseudonocardia sp.]